MKQTSRIVIVSNRLPVHRVKKGGRSVWRTSPGGLVSALTPVLQDRSSTWIGWAGAAGTNPAPFTHDGIRNLPVKVTRDELNAYYDGFSNRTLWPLYHDAIRPPEYHRRWWRPYEAINQRFAEAAAQAVARKGLVWVHDYHLQLVPGMLRQLRPDVRIGFFLHIPFPPQELFAQLPWRKPILEGLLGADVVAFHTKIGAQNFRQLARRFARAEIRGSDLEHESRRIRVRAMPISIDVEKFETLAAAPDVRKRSERFRARLGRGRRIILGVDRMDYTKGIDIRLRAFYELLRAERCRPEDAVFVQVGVPSRERVEEYKTLQASVEQQIGRINGAFGELGRTPVQYLHRSLPVDELVALYRAADVMMVSPLRDGMNLVAKEYVATRLDNDGVLILSEFTGAANELRASLLVNPHDINGIEDALESALAMPPGEQRRRMRSLRRAVRKRDVFRWAREFFEALDA
jgi:trehalose 6-phosphate synthase